MPLGRKTLKLDKSAGPLRQFLAYTFHDWTREMPRSKRILTYVGILLQGYTFYSLLMWALMEPKLHEWLREVPWLSANLLLLPRRPASGMLVVLAYLTGHWIQNGMLASEFVRKTQLETDQTAARQIQQTLQPEQLEPLQGYELETFYKPLREVGGDYFDVVELPGNGILFALADVAGKGMAAALLAANIQALVRSIASVDCGPLALADQINKHLLRYSPMDRFATAVFIVLNRDSGELTYVNAGHNPPIVFSSESKKFLEATGLPLGLFPHAEYELRRAVLHPGGTLLIFTDGLTDSIQGEPPENQICDAFAGSSGRMMANLRSLVDPKFNEDDVTILLVKRKPNFAHCGISSNEP